MLDNIHKLLIIVIHNYIFIFELSKIKKIIKKIKYLMYFKTFKNNYLARFVATKHDVARNFSS